MSRLETDTKPCPLCGRPAEGYEWPHCVNEGVQINGGEVEDCPLANVSMSRKAWQSLPRSTENAHELIDAFQKEVKSGIYEGCRDGYDSARSNLLRACIYPRVSSEDVDRLVNASKEAKELAKWVKDRDPRRWPTAEELADALTRTMSPTGNRVTHAAEALNYLKENRR